MLRKLWKFIKKRNSQLVIGACLILLPIAFYAHERTQIDTLNLRLEQASREASDYTIAISSMPRTPETINTVERLRQARERLESSQLELLAVNNKFILIVVLGVLLGSGTILLEYLDIGKDSRFSKFEHLSDEELEMRIDDLLTNVSPQSPDQEAKQSLTEGDHDDARMKGIVLLLNDTKARLADEVRRSGRRSNLNLVIGVLISATACAALVYMVNRPHQDLTQMPAVWAFYLPRITTTALIETIAYFFLRLYKETLAEIKFYQNERTSLMALELAWRMSPWPEASDVTALVVGQIVKFDRNRCALDALTSDSTEPSQTTELAKFVLKSITDSVKSKD